MTHPRVQVLLDIITKAGVDAVALIPGANLQYLTGNDFHLMERPLVVFFMPGRDPVAVLPSLEADRMKASGIPMTLFPWTDTEGYHGAFAAALNELKLSGRRLGVEELRMRVLEAQTIEEHAADVRIVPIGAALAELRLYKDADAVAHLRAAIRISQDALQACIAQVRPGMTEREIKGILVVEQLRRGGGKHPFEPVVTLHGRSASGNRPRGCARSTRSSRRRTRRDARQPGRAWWRRTWIASRARSSRTPDTGSTSRTAPGTASAWKRTKGRISSRAIPRC
jgi:Xaa-Pro dipeptidase